MRAIWDNMLHSLEIVAPVGSVGQNYVVTKIVEKVDESEREEHAVLFMPGNADHFTVEKSKEGKKLKTVFMEFFRKALRKQRETISFKTSTHLQDRVKRSRKGGWF